MKNLAVFLSLIAVLFVGGPTEAHALQAAAVAPITMDSGHSAHAGKIKAADQFDVAVLVANGKTNVVASAPFPIATGDSILFGANASSDCSGAKTPRAISAFLGKLAWFCQLAQWYYTNNSNTGSFYSLGTPNNGILTADAHTNSSVFAALVAANRLTASTVTTFLDQTAGTNQSAAKVVFLQGGINNSQNKESNAPGGFYFGTGITAPGSDAAFTTLFHADYSQMIADTKTYAPSAQIILINFGNLAYLNGSSELPDDALAGGNTAADCGSAGKTSGSGNNCGKADRLSRLANADINARCSVTPNNTTTFLCVDWACASFRYNPINNTNPGSSIHPVDAGHTALATLIENTITTPVLPQAHCTISTAGFTGTVTNAPSGSFAPL